jgi:hypothetical protein
MGYLNRSLSSTGFFAAGLILLFITENMLYGSSLESSTLNPGYFIGLFLSIILVGISYTLRILRLQLKGTRRQVDLSILLAQIVVTLGIVFYFLESREIVADWFRNANNPEAAQDWQDMFKLIAFLFTLGGMLFITFKEISYFRMDHLEHPDKTRLTHAGRSSLIITLTLANVFLAWYILSFQDWDIELIETAGRSEPTVETLAMTEVIPDDMQIAVKLFYPYGSDTRAFLENYFDSFTYATDQFQVEVIDAELEPELAQEYDLDSNGHVIITNGTDFKKESINPKMNNALYQLQGFDRKVFQYLNELITPSKTIYFTSGHGELSRTKQDTHLAVQGQLISLPALRIFWEHLKAKHFTAKDLDYQSGLASEIPDDCDILVIAAPAMPFSDSALASVELYLSRGGRLFIILDPEQAGSLDPLLDYLQLDYSPYILHNDDPNATLNGRINYIPGINFSNHETVRVLRSQQYAYVAALTTGYLEKDEDADSDFSIDMLMASPDGTWADTPVPSNGKEEFQEANSDMDEQAAALLNQLRSDKSVHGNGEFDPEKESKGVYHLAAAISKTIDTHESGVDGDTDSLEMRVVVTASRYLTAIPGINEVFMDGIINWLNPKPASAAKAMPAPPQKETSLFKTTADQMTMFWASIIIVPILILVIGIVIYIFRSTRQTFYLKKQKIANQQ